MAMANFLALFLLMELIAGGYRDGANGLSMNYYVFSCPFAEPIVRNTVASALQSDPTLAAGLSGGPVYDIPKGRKDGRRSKIEDTFTAPAPSFNASELVRAFGQRGFSARDMVALSGAHTLGVARCSSFKNRLGDPTMDSDFSKTLSKTCSGGDNAEQPFDMTRNNFDNSYFQALQRKSGLLFSDQTLYSDPRTKSIADGYAKNQATFFLDFQQAMVKMSLLDVKEGSKGEVRSDCRRIN
ncbi:hypothetical protein OIU85_003891 [Salix viminalis]|uniref:Plant heme peroxidase family profile domain-containing protein n=1 Tax=Salix viminalis TaxID=40686 RepID=A0A9Q0T1U1_SALVM|nr:hypothetical protein OIU85_003891 [Salix viminalis]